MLAAMDLRGLEQAARVTRDAGRHVPAALAAGFFLALTDVVTKAVEYAPRDTGDLEGSAYLTRPVVRGNTIAAEFGFSDPKALFVHEKPARHANGRWKFLAAAVNEDAASLATEAARHAAPFLDGTRDPRSVPAVHPTSPPPPRMRQKRAARPARQGRRR